ncbi:hypothetical protein AYI69_g11468 [Smittium culicis]|uniref:Uncharacterized protein n=1 Tax=Smittium culicis TaxID=133412 RepID=A0A1R1WYF9_9FUNG|nr:hypothetical protein AYI69_g11468 [Smittium culicis]
MLTRTERLHRPEVADSETISIMDNQQKEIEIKIKSIHLVELETMPLTDQEILGAVIIKIKAKNFAKTYEID